MILLTQRPVCRADFGIHGHAFAVVAKGHPRPVDIDVVSVDALLKDPIHHFAMPGTMVVVGLSRVLTPSNRVKVGPLVLRQRPGIRRVLADNVLFVSEPWRLFWHFFAIDHNPWGYPNSFLAESRWRMAFTHQTEDPFSAETVTRAARGHVFARDPFRFAPVTIETVPVPDHVKVAYAEEKERAFHDEKTLPAIVDRLARVAQDAVPARSIPAIGNLWRKPPTRIVRTELAVDTFLVTQIEARMHLTNAIVDAATRIP